jgi:hypothetical protein
LIWNGEAVRSWGATAVLGVSPMSKWRGSPHEQLPFALGVPEASPEGVVYLRRAVLAVVVSVSYKLWFHNMKTFARTLRQAASILQERLPQ